jgi:hypothetical protein
MWEEVIRGVGIAFLAFIAFLFVYDWMRPRILKFLSNL